MISLRCLEHSILPGDIEMQYILGDGVKSDTSSPEVVQSVRNLCKSVHPFATKLIGSPAHWASALTVTSSLREGAWHLDSFKSTQMWSFVCTLKDNSASAEFSIVQYDHPFLELQTIGSASSPDLRDLESPLSLPEVGFLDEYLTKVEHSLFVDQLRPLHLGTMDVGDVTVIAGDVFHKTPSSEEGRHVLILTAAA